MPAGWPGRETDPGQIRYLCRGGNLTEATARALELIYARTFETAKAVATSVLEARDAEDVASETMIRAARRLEQGRSLEQVEQLVPIMAYGIAVDAYRERGEVPAGLGRVDDQLGQLLHARSLNYDQYEFGLDFDAGVRGLEEPDRDAYILTELRGLTLREAGDVLSTSKDTVHRRAEAARLTVRKEITA